MKGCGKPSSYGALLLLIVLLVGMEILCLSQDQRQTNGTRAITEPTRIQEWEQGGPYPDRLVATGGDARSEAKMRLDDPLSFDPLQFVDPNGNAGGIQIRGHSGRARSIPLERPTRRPAGAARPIPPKPAGTPALP